MEKGDTAAPEKEPATKPTTAARPAIPGQLQTGDTAETAPAAPATPAAPAATSHPRFYALQEGQAE